MTDGAGGPRGGALVERRGAPTIMGPSWTESEVDLGRAVLLAQQIAEETIEEARAEATRLIATAADQAARLADQAVAAHEELQRGIDAAQASARFSMVTAANDLHSALQQLSRGITEELGLAARAMQAVVDRFDTEITTAARAVGRPSPLLASPLLATPHLEAAVRAVGQAQTPDGPAPDRPPRADAAITAAAAAAAAIVPPEPNTETVTPKTRTGSPVDREEAGTAAPEAPKPPRRAPRPRKPKADAAAGNGAATPAAPAKRTPTRAAPRHIANTPAGRPSKNGRAAGKPKTGSAN
jgi:hypothetical protein